MDGNSDVKILHVILSLFKKRSRLVRWLGLLYLVLDIKDARTHVLERFERDLMDHGVSVEDRGKYVNILKTSLEQIAFEPVFDVGSD